MVNSSVASTIKRLREANTSLFSYTNIGGDCVNEDMKAGSLMELQGVKEEISTIEAELKRKGFDEPKGFSVLKGYVEDRMNELSAER